VARTRTARQYLVTSVSEVSGTSLAKKHPQLARQWHLSKNGTVSAKNVVPSSLEKVWWKCPEKPREHIWQAVIRDRTSKGTGCPYCAGQKVCRSNCLATLFPSIAKEWHPTKNGKLTAADIVAGSKRHIWWQCDLGHVWRTYAYNRTRNGTGCPQCSTWRRAPSQSLAGVYPKVAKLWHPSRNGNISASHISPGSSQVMWWQCSKNKKHEWQAKVGALTLRGRGCPQCKSEELRTVKSFAARCPDLVPEWHLRKNAPLTPQTVTAFSRKKVWWQCRQDKTHQWQAPVADRSTGYGRCPHCARQRSDQGKQSLTAQLRHVAKLWHRARNGDLSPSDVSVQSNRVVWWQCAKVRQHIWRQSVRVQAARGARCPKCKGRGAQTNSVAKMHPQLARQWHPSRNGTLTPRDIGAGSDRMVWWRCCAGPDHEWQATIFQRTHMHTRCPFCVNQRASVTNSLRALYPHVAKEWHPTENFPDTPDTVVGESSKRFWWKCKSGHVWSTRIQDRTVRGTGCARCRKRKLH